MSKEKTKDFVFHSHVTPIVDKIKDEIRDGRYIEGFASTVIEDRDGDIIPPDVFNLERFMLNPQVFINHHLLEKEDGIEVAVGHVEAIAVALVKDNSEGLFIVEDTETGKLLGILDKTQHIDLKAGDTGLWIRAHITEDTVWEQIQMGNLNAFSWSGRVNGVFEEDEDGWEKLVSITSIDLFEISVVNIPANPAAIFSIAKALSKGKDVCGGKCTKCVCKFTEKTKQIEPTSINKIDEIEILTKQRNTLKDALDICKGKIASLFVKTENSDDDELDIEEVKSLKRKKNVEEEIEEKEESIEEETEYEAEKSQFTEILESVKAQGEQLASAVESFKSLSTRIEGVENSMTSIEERMTALESKSVEEVEEDTQSESTSESTEETETIEEKSDGMTEFFNAVMAQFEEQNAKFEKMAGEVASMTAGKSKRLTPGGSNGENTEISTEDLFAPYFRGTLIR